MSPFGFGKSEEEKQREAEAEARAGAAMAAIQGGGVTPEAERRLAALREAGGLFSSTLSVNELARLRELKVRPITQVMGSSVYHVGWQRSWGYRSWGRGSVTHMDVLSHAHNDVRHRALARLEQEALLAGAHAVVAVKVNKGSYDWASDAIEYLITGTAVALGDEPLPERPALSTLTAEDFWKLRRAGYRPVGVPGASSIWYVVPSWDTQRMMQGGRFFGGARNAEIQDFTQALYNARGHAQQQFQQQAQALGCDGVVGVEFIQRPRVRVVEVNDSERIDLVVTVEVIGTGVVADGSGQAPPPPRTTVDLRSAPGRPTRV